MTRRVTVGPFNRVEGDLEVRLDIDDGVVTSAEVTAPLYRGFEQILRGRPALDALTLAPRICGICSVSQSLAAAAALRAVDGLRAADNGVLAANLAHAAENAADHLTHFYLFFMPDFARDAYAARPWHPDIATRFKAVQGSAAQQMLPARARLLQIMGLLAGKWPHSLAFQPGGTTRAIDLGERVQLLSIIGDLRDVLERIVFADSLDNVLALDSAAALERWREGRGGDFARFLALADDLALDRLGRIALPLMSYGAYHGGDAPLFAAGVFDPATAQAHPLDPDDISEDVARASMRDTSLRPSEAETDPDADKQAGYSWCKAPRLAGRPVEVGALARQAVDGDPLIRDLLARQGPNVSVRVIARLIETARLAAAMHDWARRLDLRAPFLERAERRGEGAGIGLIEAARGSLGHWIELSDDNIRRYQIIAPTTWNFSPRDRDGVAGPLEQALAGTAVGDEGARSVAIQHIVRSFDPCMVCTAH
ncbi:nickel-dependent hydrogenase large subunit [Rhodopseudomonas pseudopalustris]|uniref:Hydrogenase large subunit n=1 Tax=Rhodopseudomonas pseudopalustris TaxID=1513892 RepID=A0A1H8NLT2_9BRAD|nr:nickel-dependent hydrogenase large subunit [Rhodopseudomonas pseudopalustris]SEO30358.1 hydrogenase large subunit [Rhodopseudomonas pseudopalustris]